MGIDITDSTFQKGVIEKSKELPVLVDFWAEWCRPCRVLKPILEKIAEEYGEDLLLAKYDLDSNQEIATKYGVRSIPLVKLFVDGEVVDEFIGAKSEHDVREWLEEKL